jgi:hypothetical protein
MRHTRKFARSFKTRPIRKHHVEQNDVRLKNRSLPHSRGGVDRLSHDHKPCLSQHPARQPAKTRVIIDDQYPRGHRGIVARADSGISLNFP